VTSGITSFGEFITLMMIGFMILGALGVIIYGRSNKVAISVFMFGAVMVAVIFLSDNPNLVESLKEHIALTLIGMVIATISIIRLAMG